MHSAEIAYRGPAVAASWRVDGSDIPKFASIHRSLLATYRVRNDSICEYTATVQVGGPSSYDLKTPDGEEEGLLGASGRALTRNWHVSFQALLPIGAVCSLRTRAGPLSQGDSRNVHRRQRYVWSRSSL